MRGTKIKKECPQCGKGFYSYACHKRKFCSFSCRCTFYNKLRTKEKEKKECPTCHNLFEVTPVRKKYCSIQCRSIARRNNPLFATIKAPHIPVIKNCLDCGENFTAKSNMKRCKKCQLLFNEKNRKEYVKKYSKTGKWKKLHNIHAIKWQHNNKKKVQAASRAKTHPEWVNILYECLCDHPNKHNHHPDYKKPFDVYKLCPTCHAAEHKRLRSLTAQAVAI
jgi:hypothetical protein